MRLRPSRETSATLPTHACVHFFPKLFPSLTEQRGSCLKLNSGIGLVKYLALTQLGNKAAISTGFEPVETFAGNRKFKIKKAKATALDPPLFSFSSSFFVLFSLEIAFRFGFYRIFDGGGIEVNFVTYRCAVWGEIKFRERWWEGRRGCFKYLESSFRSISSFQMLSFLV